MALVLTLALGVMGCSSAECVDNVCPCTEAGIRAAIDAGGEEPFTFDCDDPTTVTTGAELVIDKDVALNGEGLLTVDAQWRHRVFSVRQGVSAELQRLNVIHGVARYGGGVANAGSLTIRGGAIDDCTTDLFWSELTGPAGGSGVYNSGEMLIIDARVSENSGIHTSGGGILNAPSAKLTLKNSTVSGNYVGVDNGDAGGGGVKNDGEMTIVNSTISNNEAAGLFSSSGGGIANSEWMSLINSTVSENDAQSADAIGNYDDAYLEVTASLVNGECREFAAESSEATWVANGHNIESPGDTCGFDHDTDQANVSADDLKLGPLSDNGGPTETHALGEGSVAIDKIPAEDCAVETDQRGEPRDSMCDVGAFEVQP